MEFTRSKKLAFFNNKGGVGKTTLAFNVAVQFAHKGYKTVLVDLDPQCNLTRLALGEEVFQNSYHEKSASTVYDILTGVINGGSDVDINIPLEEIGAATDNLFLIRGDLRLSEYEDLLATAYTNATAGQPLGFFQTSAIYRFLNEKALTDQVDIFIIDTSPTLGLLNRVILLGIDYFVVPVNPDAFSLQGIENLGIILEKWKRQWKDTAIVMSKSNRITIDQVLNGEALFIGYILNAYNIYGERPIKNHRKWIDMIPDMVREYLSEKHSRSGLVVSSHARSLHDIQDYGRLPSISHETGEAIFDIDPVAAEVTQPGSKENIEKSKVEFDELSDAILEILQEY
jgi:cellulose biosynthesis protein BcsQ